ncbi:MAG TPA: pyruvate kinase alpha/beta domain-containing protein [bacterium]|nr:pyruvate kinase alpha/beta domain-containing protein [bacterium]
MYFEKAGPQNTDAVIKAALETARDRGLKHIVAAATVGTSVDKLVKEAGPNVTIVAVTHNVGFGEEGKGEFDPRIREAVTKAGHFVLTATLATRNINKAISTRFGGYSQTEIVNAALRIFGQGTKVAIEITAMAADAGLIPFDDIIALGGTGRGWDTALIIRANSSNRFFDIKVREIICKPWSF